MARRRELLSTVVTGALAGSLLGWPSEQAGAVASPHSADYHDDYPNRRDSDRVWMVEADPGFGFNFPYWLAMPESTRAGTVPLMVEVNNARREQSLDTLKDRVWDQITRFGLQGPWLSEELGIPQLIPVFPWPYGDPLDESHSTISLDRETLYHTGSDYERLDRQLLRMVDHARHEELPDIETHDRVVFYGNSSGGVAGERMAMLHPEAILAVASGGLNGIAVLPLETLGDQTLNYPVGVADYESLTGKPFDPEAVDAVDRFYFQGGADEVDRLPTGDQPAGGDFADPGVLETAQAVYGLDMVRDRFPRCHIAFEKAGVSAQFRIYPEMEHNPGPASHDILEFYERSIAGEDVSDFGQRLELPLDVELEADWEATANQVSVEYAPVGSSPPPEGLVSYTWELGDGTTKTGLRVGHSYDAPGSYLVTLSMETAHGQQAETEAEFFFDAPSFQLVDYDLSAAQLQVGESLIVSVTVGNSGTRRGPIPAELSVDGGVVDQSSVDLDAGEETELTLEHTFESPGEYELELNDGSIGSVQVTSGPTPTTTTETTAETPGFGAVAALVGVSGAVGSRLFRYRSDGE